MVKNPPSRAVRRELEKIDEANNKEDTAKKGGKYKKRNKSRKNKTKRNKSRKNKTRKNKTRKKLIKNRK